MTVVGNPLRDTACGGGASQRVEEGVTDERERFEHEAKALRGSFFARGRPITVAQSSGWIDLIGGGEPVTGGLALGWPLGPRILVALQPDPEPTIRLRGSEGSLVELPTAVLWDAEGWPHEYDAIAAAVAEAGPLARLAAASWAAMLREEFARFPGGARLLIQVAESPGWQVGLAAAIAQTLVSAYGIRLAPRELALTVAEGLRRVANHGGGALAAAVAVCGRAAALLPIHQQPAWLWGPVALPPGTAIYGLRVGDGPKQPTAPALSVALACRAVADAFGLSSSQAQVRWRGYLANLGTVGLAQLRHALPEELSGAEALDRHGSLDGVTVLPAGSYPVRAAATFAVEEHLRARTVVALLRAAASRGDPGEELRLVGELLLLSHESQRAVAIGDAHADRLVEAVFAAGPGSGLYGARAAAPASGATLVVLASTDAAPKVRSIAESYAAEAGCPVTIFEGSVAGCGPAGASAI